MASIAPVPVPSHYRSSAKPSAKKLQLQNGLFIKIVNGDIVKEKV